MNYTIESQSSFLPDSIQTIDDVISLGIKNLQEKNIIRLVLTNLDINNEIYPYWDASVIKNKSTYTFSIIVHGRNNHSNNYTTHINSDIDIPDDALHHMKTQLQILNLSDTIHCISFVISDKRIYNGNEYVDNIMDFTIKYNECE